MMNDDAEQRVLECRSALYMPARNQRVLQKGPTLPADAIIVDLEDSVAPQEKGLARDQAVQALSHFDYGYRIRALRINAGDSPYYAEDIAAAGSACPDALVLPKVESPKDVLALSDAMDTYPQLSSTQIWAMIESPMAVLNAQHIAAVSQTCPRLSMFLIGNNDLAMASNMSVTSTRTYLLPWLMHLIAAAHAYRLKILDGVFNDFSDTSGFERECEQGAAMGMHGKTLIHPTQISIANEHFMPSTAEVDHARRIVEAFSLAKNARVGVLQIDGRMVERLHLSMAEKLLARVARLAARA